jgi:hypothetical protein
MDLCTDRLQKVSLFSYAVKTIKTYPGICLRRLIRKIWLHQTKYKKKSSTYIVKVGVVFLRPSGA